MNPSESPTSALAFAKYEGLGNDFVIVEHAEGRAPAVTESLAIAMCDRHRGVGADGVLEVGVTAGRPFMEVARPTRRWPARCCCPST